VAHQASARLEQLGGEAALSVAESHAPERSPKTDYGPGGVRYRAVSPFKTAPWDLRSDLGADANREFWTAPSRPPRGSRWLWKWRKNAGIVRIRRFRRCTGGLNATQTGS